MVRYVSQALFCAILAISAPALAQQNGSNSAAHFVIKDMRGNDRASVLRMAAQGTEDLPVIVLFGADRTVLAKVRGAVARAERAGYGARAILVGPTDTTPSLEIYASTRTLGRSDKSLGMFANSWKVTNPIDPFAMEADELVSLLHDINREYYPVR